MMKTNYTNYTTKQFAEYLRKLVIERDEDWRVGKVSESAAGEEYYGKGPWFFFNVAERYPVNDRKSECGVYVGPRRTIMMECFCAGGGKIGKADDIFERRLRDVLAGR